MYENSLLNLALSKDVSSGGLSFLNSDNIDLILTDRTVGNDWLYLLIEMEAIFDLSHSTKVFSV